MHHLYIALKLTFSYFSILPVPFKTTEDLSKKEVLGLMPLFLPLVGFVLGLLTITLYSLLSIPAWYGATISAIAYMLLYGFIHTEAVMDVADAIYASHSNKDAYSIIKDATVGSMGVLYGIAIVLLKVSGIVILLTQHLFVEFISILIISRLSILILIKTDTFKSSFITQLKEDLNGKYIIITFIIFTLIGTILTAKFIPLLLLGLALGFIVSILIKRALGFINGDVLGATLEVIEVILFLSVALWH